MPRHPVPPVLTLPDADLRALGSAHRQTCRASAPWWAPPCRASCARAFATPGPELHFLNALSLQLRITPQRERTLRQSSKHLWAPHLDPFGASPGPAVATPILPLLCQLNVPISPPLLLPLLSRTSCSPGLESGPAWGLVLSPRGCRKRPQEVPGLHILSLPVSHLASPECSSHITWKGARSPAVRPPQPLSLPLTAATAVGPGSPLSPAGPCGAGRRIVMFEAH